MEWVKLVTGGCSRRNSGKVQLWLSIHRFVEDRETWNIDAQFLWGPALLISPVLKLVSFSHLLLNSV